MMALILPALTLLKEVWASKVGRTIILGLAAVLAVLSYGAWQRSAGRAEVRAEWRASVERARAAIKEDDREAARLAKASDDEFTKILALEATKRAEVYRALVNQIQDGSCIVSDTDARGLQPR